MKNYWIIEDKNRKFRSVKKFAKIDEIKRYCVCEMTQYEKKNYLDGGNLLHVDNGKIISMIDITSLGQGMLLFSDVHILNNPIEV